mgnify:CR=1 FL=1
MKKRIAVLWAMLFCCITLLSGCGTNADVETEILLPHQQDLSGRRVEFIFHFEKQSGMGSNQFAVWIEDAQGQFVKTVYATQWTALGGYEIREMSLANWVEKASPSSLSSAELDAITSATPQSGTYKVVWVIDEGDTGDYRYIIEGSTYMEEYVLFEGVVTLGDKETEEKPTGAFSANSPKNGGMITDVVVRYYSR